MNLEQLVAAIRQASTQTKVDANFSAAAAAATANKERFWTLMRDVTCADAELEPYAHLVAGEAYTRNLIATDDATFTLMLLCWRAGASSPVHNHPQSECLMRMLRGSVRETRYRLREEARGDAPAACPLVRLCETTLVVGDVACINDSIGLHRVENPHASDVAWTLHLYMPPYQSSLCFEEASGDFRQLPMTAACQSGATRKK
jgi:cysteine dioxygenase